MTLISQSQIEPDANIGILSGNFNSSGQYLLSLIPSINGIVGGAVVLSGVSPISVFPSGQNVIISGNFAGFTQNSQTGLFYPRTNPSGYVMSSQTGIFLTQSITDTLYYSISNPSSFINQALTDSLYYGINNPSGFITGVPTGQLTGQFYPLKANPSGYLPSGNLIGVSGLQIIPSGNNLVLNYTGNNGVSSVGINASGYVSISGNQINFVNPVNGSGGFSTINANTYFGFGASPVININLASGNYFIINFSGASGVASANPSFTFSNAVPGSNAILEIVQNAATGLSCVFPANTIQAGGGGNTYVATGINFIDIIALAFKDSGHARIAITRNYS